MTLISFRAVPNQRVQKSTELSENGQKVLERTNPILNQYNQMDMVYSAAKDKDIKERAKIAGSLIKECAKMDINANPIVSTSYVVNQYKSGNISKSDAEQIMAKNALTWLNAIG